MASLGLAFALSPNLLLETDVNWTGWSSFDEVPIDFTGGPQRLPDADDPRALGRRLQLPRRPALDARARPRSCASATSSTRRRSRRRRVSPLLPDADRNGFTIGYGHTGKHRPRPRAHVPRLRRARAATESFPDEGTASSAPTTPQAVLFGLHPQLLSRTACKENATCTDSSSRRPLGLSCSCSRPAAAAAQVDTGTANFTRYVALGDSLTAGFMSGGLVRDVQLNSYPALIFRQATGTATGFEQPLVSAAGHPAACSTLRSLVADSSSPPSRARRATRSTSTCRAPTTTWRCRAPTSTTWWPTRHRRPPRPRPARPGLDPAPAGAGAAADLRHPLGRQQRRARRGDLRAWSSTA